MTTKLHVNLSQGIIDVEGDPAFVRAIYDDFKNQLLDSLKGIGPASPAYEPKFADAPDAGNDTPAKPKAKRRASGKRKSSGEQDGSGISSEAPKLDKQLDTAKLPAFYAGYTVKNHPEKILVFLKFLTEVAGVESPNSDQVFTCYKAVGEKLPVAFAQAFRDTSGKGYIDLKSSTDMPVTIAGDNHFNFKLKKAAE